MILNRECDYSFRIIRALADGNKKTVVTICEEESIPSPYSYKILKKLEKHGFVKSSRGRGGGYILNCNLDSFNVFDVISVMNENLFFLECIKDDSPDCIHLKGGKICSVHNAFLYLQKKMEDEMRSRTMREILEFV